MTKKRKRTVAIIALAILALLALAALRGRASRELILKSYGLPMANLRGSVLVGADLVRTTTDVNGKLDLSFVPAETELIRITLEDNSGIAFNGWIQLPTRGSRIIDMRGNQSICTTKRHVLGLFQHTDQEIWTRHDADAAPPDRQDR